MYILQTLNLTKNEETIDYSLLKNAKHNYFLEQLFQLPEYRSPKYENMYYDLFAGDYKDINFYTACDILDMDYDKIEYELAAKFFTLYDNPEGSDRIAARIIEEVLCKYHYMLFTEEIGNELLRDFTIACDDWLLLEKLKQLVRVDKELLVKAYNISAFTFVRLLKEYVHEVARGNEKLADAGTFRLFAITYLHTLIPESSPIKPRDEDEQLNLQKFVSALESSADGVVTFYSESLVEFLNANIYYVLSTNKTFRVCKNCGRLFVPAHRSDTSYCDRRSPQNGLMTCKEYGTKRLWYEKLKTDEVKKMYRNIYAQKQMLCRRNPDIENYQSDFENYKRCSKQWKADVKNGVKSEKEFLAWLKSVKKRGALNGQHNKTK